MNNIMYGQTTRCCKGRTYAPSSRSLSTSPNNKVFFVLLSLADPVSIIRISLEVRKEKSKLPDSKTETISVDAKNVGSEILGVHSIRRISRNMSPVG